VELSINGMNLPRKGANHPRDRLWCPNGSITFWSYASGYWSRCSNLVLTPGNWYHVVFLKGNGSDDKIFINGVNHTGGCGYGGSKCDITVTAATVTADVTLGTNIENSILWIV